MCGKQNAEIFKPIKKYKALEAMDIGQSQKFMKTKKTLKGY